MLRCHIAPASELDTEGQSHDLRDQSRVLLFILEDLMAQHSAGCMRTWSRATSWQITGGRAANGLHSPGETLISRDS